jgi:1-deoxy-D-xylulose-5-phosphate reductoisomerase
MKDEYKQKNVSILGSTGSIGTNAVEVIKHHKDRFKVIGISAYSNIDLLEEQTKSLSPEYVVIGQEEAYREFKKRNTSSKLKILFGDDGLNRIATEDNVEYIVNALVGFKGFIPTMEALKKGKVCAIANKETIVVGGSLIMKTAIDKDRQIVPIDSEHCAIHSLISNRKKKDIAKIILTSSGGPFRTKSKEELDKVTLEEALNHPTWSMGNKITIDSATMMNKGFEVIEAHHLFDVDYDDIEVIVHKESIIHSMIETIDGEIYAQLSINDMKFPIQYALTYPKIVSNKFERLNLAKIGSLHFETPDCDKFPLLSLAYEVGRKGGTLPAVLNASNEVAVNKFLSKEIDYTDIYKYIYEAVKNHSVINNPTYDDIIQSDKWARNFTKKLIRYK